MQISKSVVKELSETIAVFLFSMFIVSSSMLRGYIVREQNYNNSDLIIVSVFALILTTAYVLFKKKYYHEKNNLRNR